MFTREFGRRFTVGHSLSAEEAAARWALVSHNGGHRIPHRLSVYLDERVRYARRWRGARLAQTARIRLGSARSGGHHQRAGRLARIESRRPVVELPGLGHYPQIEDPDAYTEAALRLLTQ